MPKDPSNDTGGSHEHGPLRGERIRPGSYSTKFLDDLKVQNKIMPVDEHWDPSRGNLPPRINWVMYPNGDLERVGFD